MKKLNQTGFAAIEAVLILVVVAILGFTGWFVWQAKQNTDESLNAANSSEQAIAKAKKSETKQQTQPADETTNWLLYESPENGWTIRLADGWQFERYQKSSSIYSFGSEFALKAGTKATVTEVEGGKDGSTGLSINYATQNIDQIVTPGQKQASLVTKDGLEVEKYYHVWPSDIEGPGPQPGDLQYTYVIRKSSNRVIVVNYSYHPSSIDYHGVVEKAVVTAHFK